MALSLTLVSDGATITAAGVRDYVEKIEYFLNEGIAPGDFNAAPWVTSTHVFKPEFYGFPNPRTQFVSGTAYYTATSDSLFTTSAHNYGLTRDAATSVVGMQKTVRVRAGSSVRILASFAAFEWGGQTNPEEGGGSLGSPTNIVAAFFLHRQGLRLPGTARNLYAGGHLPATAFPSEDAQTSALVARKQFCMSHLYPEAATQVVTYGVNLGLTNGRLAGDEEHKWKHVFVLQRNFVVDCSDF